MFLLLFKHNDNEAFLVKVYITGVNQQYIHELEVKQCPGTKAKIHKK